MPEQMHHVMMVNDVTGRKIRLSYEPMTRKQADAFRWSVDIERHKSWRRPYVEEIKSGDPVWPYGTRIE